MFMRKYFLFLLMTVSILFSFSSPAVAQDIPDDGEEVIVIDITNQNTETDPQRSLPLIPILASYHILLSCLEVFFQYDMGDVTITVTNITAGYNYTTIIESYCGTTILPLQLSPGLWRITFLSGGSGTTYSGTFFF